jgi:hypothetical protein
MSKVMDPGMICETTLYQEMPEQVAEVLQKHNLKIKLDKVVVNKLFDQMPGVMAKDGCISAPSGPSC